MDTSTNLSDGSHSQTFRDDSMTFDVNSAVTYPMSQLRLENRTTDKAPHISKYVKTFSRLSIDKPLAVKNCKIAEPKESSICRNENRKNEEHLTSNTFILHGERDNCNSTKYKIYSLKRSSEVRYSPLMKQESGLTVALGRKQPKLRLSLMSQYMRRVLNETRRHGFKFDTPSPDELASRF